MTGHVVFSGVTGGGGGGEGAGGDGAGAAGVRAGGRGTEAGTGLSAVAVRPARTAGAAGDGVGGVLRAIRRRIEEVRVYPDSARSAGIEGTVELRFRIRPDGGIEAVEILRSSGSPVLDAASEATIRRAAPLPVVAGWIRLPLSYRLDQGSRR